MVTDRRILVSNENITVDLTEIPFTVEKIKGFDRLQVQLVTSQGFDQIGASLINDYVQPRNMEISGQLMGETTERIQELRDMLLSAFLPETDIIINHYYGGQNRLITVRVENTPQFGFTQVSTVQTYDVQLTAVEPYWRDTTESLMQIANIKGDFHFPLIIPVSMGVHFGVKSPYLIVNVHNKSPIKSGIKIVFIANGYVKNPQLFNIKTREYIRLLCEMEAGEQITIQTGEDKTIVRVKNGLSENYIGKIDLEGGGSTFLELDSGDNLLRHLADSGQDVLETEIYYCNKYVGV